MTNDTSHFKEKLEKELATLETELKSVGQEDPKNIDGWNARKGDEDPIPGDRSEVADSLETLEENTAVVGQLEKQLHEVEKALEKIKKGAYGSCEICHQPIEADRLEANPSARTCKAHLKDL
ncbi:MAG: TraR/DksA C4-type zinc finger protein [Candidatus Pacebacteria bacterium]|nr:TraR/DksA C4-type zinc finger protein [Candidatus Paceibacterota bacterium]